MGIGQGNAGHREPQRAIAGLLNVSIDYLLDEGESLSMNRLREPD